MKTSHKISLAALLAAAVAGCASGGMPGAMTGADIDKLTADIARASFRDEGIVKADKVLDVDATLRACNAADVAASRLMKRHRPRP